MIILCLCPPLTDHQILIKEWLENTGKHWTNDKIIGELPAPDMTLYKTKIIRRKISALISNVYNFIHLSAETGVTGV